MAAKHLEQYWLGECLRQVEQKLDWGDSTHWHNAVFQELSEVIATETQTVLSPTTLKRVWGRLRYQNTPSISTLNALAQFIGYKNWRAFKDQNPQQPTREGTNFAFPRNQVIIITSAALLTIAFISFFSLIIPDSTPGNEQYEQVTFSSQPVTHGIPNSVLFEFDLSGISSKQIRIQQFWDPSKTIDLHKEQKQATGIYYYPGYFRSKLIVDDQVIREHDLYIKSDQWLATLDYTPIPKYLVDSVIHQGIISLPPEMKKEISSSEEPRSSTFHYVEKFDDLSADNFDFNVTIKNVYREKWAVCQKTSLIILGSKGAMIVPFSIIGCVSDLNVMLNDHYISGKEKDLSALGIDFSEPRNIELMVRDKHVTVKVDGKEVMQETYAESLGKLAGFRLRFLGAAEVHSLRISDPKNKEFLKL